MVRANEAWRGLAAVVATWLLLVGLLLGLQAAGRNFGFNVWWSGEARTWLMWLQDGPGILSARTFWEIDGRNPLVPWWYIPVRSFIIEQPASFFILHLVTSLLLGLASYLAVVAVTAGRGRPFGMALGMITAVYLCSTRTDNIHWPFIGALACSLLSVACFAQHLNSGRRSLWLAWSLIFWLVAFQTYTIQIGAMLAVGGLSFLDGERSVSKRIGQAAADALPFAVTLMIFVLVWRTAAGGITEATGLPDPARAMASVGQGLWHGDYSTYLAWARHLGPKLILFVVLVVAPLVVAVQAVAGGASGRDGAPIGLPDLGRVLAVGVALVAPTVAVEATSPMHLPGSRWVMVLQFWAPLIALSGVALAVLALPKVARLWTWRAAASGLAAGAVLLTLGMNQTQTYMRRDEQAFMVALEQIAARDPGPVRAYVIRYAPGYWIPSDFVGRAYARTEFGEIGETTFRYLAPGEAAPAGALFWDGSHMRRGQPDEMRADGSP